MDVWLIAEKYNSHVDQPILQSSFAYKLEFPQLYMWQGILSVGLMLPELSGQGNSNQFLYHKNTELLYFFMYRKKAVECTVWPSHVTYNSFKDFN